MMVSLTLFLRAGGDAGGRLMRSHVERGNDGMVRNNLTLAIRLTVSVHHGSVFPQPVRGWVAVIAGEILAL